MPPRLVSDSHGRRRNLYAGSGNRLNLRAGEEVGLADPSVALGGVDQVGPEHGPGAADDLEAWRFPACPRGAKRAFVCSQVPELPGQDTV